MRALLSHIIDPERIRDELIDRISYASDAGFYQLVPAAVVQPVSEEEIRGLFRFSREHKIPLVFRTGGTSLSGQSVTNGILVDLSQHWNRIRVEDNGRKVRVQPGITGGMVNAYLRKYSAKIGPDPSSISAAMMGGILSNNSSGMCCGVRMNSYHTMRHIRFILPDGKCFSTEQPGEPDRFLQECPQLAEELATIRGQILGSPALFEKIRNKYRTKNTVGYSLNAFIDHEHPLDILAHLLIGAEGTLAFIAEAVMETVPDHPYKSTALLYFRDIPSACQAIVPLTDSGAMMVELMDRASLRSVETMAGMPPMVRTLPDDAAALLIEFQEASPEALAQRVDHFLASASRFALLNAPAFTSDAAEREFLWKVRKGLFPAVGAVRKSGTSVLLEDLAFPVDQLAGAILDMQELFRKYEYHNGILFGHAKDGNIHFIITQSLNTSHDVERYDRFMRDVVDITVNKYNGALKAEHGTGRNMAPFVETEWGGEAYDIMRRIKKAVDPDGLLNPGVIINDDPEAHLKDLKRLPTVEEEVDRCIECGYCEHKCPSKDLTTSPRRRIVLRRALKQMEASGQKEDHAKLLEQYQYHGLDTCAVDGLCATACPVDINTGDLVKRLRRENHSPAANRRAAWVARHFAFTVSVVRTGLRLGTMMNRVFGKGTMTGLTGMAKRVFPSMPVWTRQMPAPPSLEALQHQPAGPASIVYFPSCVSRAMGSYEGRSRNIMETFLGVCEKAGLGVKIVNDVRNACCSQTFGSKGFAEAQRIQANRIIAQLWESSDEGKLPVVIDVSSCAYTLHHLRPVLDDTNRKRFDGLRILDAVDMLHDMVLPRVSVRPLQKRIVLHPVCSLEKMNTAKKLERVARAMANDVNVPMNAGCCGMAGDRGFLFPELTASATSAEAAEVCAAAYDGYYSSTKTCEMAMSHAVERNYESILYLVYEAI